MERKLTGVTPAMLRAAATREVDISAAMPGGIEASEKLGQIVLVRSTNMPKDMGNQRPLFEQAGFVFGELVHDCRGNLVRESARRACRCRRSERSREYARPGGIGRRGGRHFIQHAGGILERAGKLFSGVRSAFDADAARCRAFVDLDARREAAHACVVFHACANIARRFQVTSAANQKLASTTTRG